MSKIFYICGFYFCKTSCFQTLRERSFAFMFCVCLSIRPKFIFILLAEKTWQISCFEANLHCTFTFSSPRLLAFSVDMQRRILSFIHQHREQFPSDGLAQLVETIPSTEISDDWVRALLNMIGRHCKSRQIESSATDGGNEPKHEEPIYTFCPSSQSSLKDLLLALQSKGLSSVVAQTKTEEDMICESDMKDESIRSGMDMDVEEYQTQQKAVNQSQLRNIGFSNQRATFDTSFISQRNPILEGHMQVKHRCTCMSLLLWGLTFCMLSRPYSLLKLALVNIYFKAKCSEESAFIFSDHV